VTDTLNPPTTTAGDSPLATLLNIANDLGTPSEDEQREDATTAALDHTWNAYPTTLGQALGEQDWNGQPAVPGAGLDPSAVAYLGDGLWLHHHNNLDRGHAVLTLIAPCSCGNGYLDYVLDGEDDLLQILINLRATGGRFPHSSTRPGCASIRRLSPWSHSRP
jgi:hypothetical protein